MKKINRLLLGVMVIGITVSNLMPVSAKEIDYTNKESLSLNDYESMSDLELNQRINKSAQAFQDLMDSNVIKFDEKGFISYIDVDGLEEKFGITDESRELRKIMEENQTKNASSIRSKRSIQKHVNNFSNCFVKQLLKDFGVYQIRNAIHEQAIKLIGEKQYFKFVQKVAQIAVKKLGKKAAAKIVSAATPAGWALHAWKVGLWSYRCTVEYDKWA